MSINLSSSPTSVVAKELNQLLLHGHGAPPVPIGEKVKTFAEDNSSIRSLPELVERIPAAVQDRKVRDIEPGSPLDPISSLLRRTELTRHDWEKFAWFDNDRPYTRNLIATDNETYTLLLLCWNPHQESPIHDHPCDGCWAKVLQGQVRERRFNDQLQCISDETLHAMPSNLCDDLLPESNSRSGGDEGTVTVITDAMGLHTIGNPSMDPSVTIHLYSPPIPRCRVWYREGHPQDYEMRNTCHYSEYGTKLGPNN